MWALQIEIIAITSFFLTSLYLVPSRQKSRDDTRHIFERQIAAILSVFFLTWFLQWRHPHDLVLSFCLLVIVL